MRYLSLFSGIEAASLAWLPLGWEAVAFAEVEPFPCAVLAERYPGVPNLGDVSAIGEAEVRRLGRIDLVVFGFPCTDLSVAGKRGGLKDRDGNLTRSGLFYEATRIVRLARQLGGCRWLVAENVPGLFSSRRGSDFSEVIREVTGLDFPVPREGWRNAGVAANADPGGWSLAWATLDAQFFGVPQRRRRVFLVGHLGDWTRPVQVLLEPESLSGDLPPRREARADVAASVTPGARRTSEDGGGELLTTVAMAFRDSGSSTWGDGLGTLSAHDAKDGYCSGLITHSLRADGFDAGEYATGGAPFIVNAAESCARQSHARPSEVARCLDSTGSFASAQGGTVVACDLRNMAETGDVSQTLQVGGHGASPSNHPHVAIRSGVRRLTPREAERLMGLPDDYTLIPVKPVPAKGQAKARARLEAGDERFADVGGVVHFVSADGPRYKAIGNSFAVPVIAWIGRRIDLVEALVRANFPEECAPTRQRKEVTT